MIQMTRTETVRVILSTILGVLGLTSLTVAAFLVSVPAGFVMLGVALLVADVSLTRPAPAPKGDEQ